MSYKKQNNLKFTKFIETLSIFISSIKFIVKINYIVNFAIHIRHLKY